ncbi:MAG TPA: PilZ domain-containing protein [Verrucomicrobiae bacterium]|jgi:hypothetical protein|nr:PilZ domain-containing protein [Verrucomicrobiae bacterium]
MGDKTDQPDSTGSNLDSGPEARRWVRHKIEVRLRVSFVLPDGKTSDAFGRANNLSHGGIAAYIPCSIPMGAAVQMELIFPGCSKEVRVKAVVRGCEGFRYGLEFTGLSDDVREMIAKTCGPFRTTV